MSRSSSQYPFLSSLLNDLPFSRHHWTHSIIAPFGTERESRIHMQYSVARDHEAVRINSAGVANSPHRGRMSYACSQRRVRHRLSERDASYRLPHLLLEGGSSEVKLQV